MLRADESRRRREDADARLTSPTKQRDPAADTGPDDADDTLVLLFLCCHESLSPASQIALTPRAVGGLSTAEIARALLAPEGTMTRRISRAKQAISASGIPFAAPDAGQWTQRLAAVRHVLYLIFTEGYAATTGDGLVRADLCREAIRLARMLHRQVPNDTETAGLLALMLLTDARRLARSGPSGEPIPMAEQDRSRWDTTAIREGVALITATLRRLRPGPYQLQAAIAAVHDEAPAAEATDWPQILALYELLRAGSDNPVVALNHAVAIAMVHGPQAGLDLLVGLADDARLTVGHRFHTARAQLLEMADQPTAARADYLEAARRTASPPRQRYLYQRAARLAEVPEHTEYLAQPEADT